MNNCSHIKKLWRWIISKKRVFQVAVTQFSWLVCLFFNIFCALADPPVYLLNASDPLKWWVPLFTLICINYKLYKLWYKQLYILLASSFSEIGSCKTSPRGASENTRGLGPWQAPASGLEGGPNPWAVPSGPHQIYRHVLTTKRKQCGQWSGIFPAGWHRTCLSHQHVHKGRRQCECSGSGEH